MSKNEYNNIQIEKLGKQIYEVHAEDSVRDRETGCIRIDSVRTSNPTLTGGLEDVIKVAVGAEYMHLKNTDLSDSLVNGATGTITQLDINTKSPLKGTIYVKFHSETIGKAAKQNSTVPGSVPIKAVTTPFSLTKYKSSVTAERTQFPGSLAWGITVHKAQGSSYDKMIAHIALPEGSKFTYKPGQIYTMLSRARTRKGLQIVGFDPKAIRVNAQALEEMKRLERDRQLSYLRPCQKINSSILLSVGHINVRSLSLHYDDVKEYSQINAMDVLCISESHVSDYTQYQIPNYSLFHSAGKHGCAIYSRKPVLHNFATSTPFEAVVVLLPLSAIVCVYIPPKAPFAQIQTFFHDLLVECKNVVMPLHHCETLYVTGDFNLPLEKDMQSISKLFAQYGLHQYITTPTHVCGNMLDLIFTNHPKVHAFAEPLYFTDHHFIGAQLCGK